jgi:hypothetical protein
MVPPLYETPASILLLLGGLVACFAGYRLFRTVLALFGFLGGAVAASAAFSGTTGLTTALVMLAGGLLGAAVLTAAYFFGVALLGAGLGAVVAHLVVTGGDREPTVLLIVLFSVGGALLTMALQRYVVIVGTAFAGAWAVVASALAMAGHPAGVGTAALGGMWAIFPFDPLPGQRWVSVAWLVLALAGLVVQLGWTAGGKKRPKRRRGEIREK